MKEKLIHDMLSIVDDNDKVLAWILKSSRDKWVCDIVGKGIIFELDSKSECIEAAYRSLSL